MPESEVLPPSAPPRLSRRSTGAGPQAISFLMQQAVENPDVISLAAGLVDRRSLPVAETRAAVAAMLVNEERARDVLQYGTTAGSERLRKNVVAHLARMEETTPDELDLDPDRIVLTTGSQQLLSIVADVLLDPGDVCLVAAPTYFVFLGVVGGVGAVAFPIETDEDGMRMDALEETLTQFESDGELDRVKMIYLVSSFENPSGVSLSNERRQKAVKIARRWSKRGRIFILEDAAYRELRYEGEPRPSVWSFDDRREHVILAHTFSKSFSPGVRVGFGVLPESLIRAVHDRKGNEDFGSAHFNQHLLATVMEHGRYEPHVEQVRASYRNKRDAMLAAADRYFSEIPGVSWVHPEGGLYVWMSLPESTPTGFESELFNRATTQEKVMYVPGEICFAGDSATRPTQHMRLSFGVQTPEGIEEGMKRLAAAVRGSIPFESS